MATFFAAQSPWARRNKCTAVGVVVQAQWVGVGGHKGCLNTSNFSSAISRLLFGCKKPELRARRKPLGNTCCIGSHKKVAPLTVRCGILPVLLSRQR
jgi:hypothetical protein